MAVTIDVTSPQDSEAVSQGASRIRELKTQLLSLIGQIFKNDGTTGFLSKWITQAMIGDTVVGTGQVVDKAITAAKMGSASIANQYPRGAADGSVSWISEPAILKNAPVPDAGGANDGQSVAVNSGAAGTFKFVLTGKLLTVANYVSTTTENQNSTTMASDAKGSLTTSQKLSAIGDMSITLKAATSSVRIFGTVPVDVSSTSCWVGLFDVTANAFVAFANMKTYGNHIQGQLALRYQSGAIGATGARIYRLYFGSTSSNTSLVTVNNAQEGMTFSLEEIAA